MPQELPEQNINISQTTGIICEECSGKIFAPGMMLRKVSRFFTGQAKDGLVPMEVLYCIKCQHVNEEFLPQGLKDVEAKS